MHEKAERPAGTNGRDGISRREFTILAAATAAAAGSWAPEARAQANIQVTDDSVDPQMSDPFIDVDEWRDAPVRHRYVHGGFKGTDLLFSMYFPPREQYQGRFFQPIMAISGFDKLAQMPGNPNIGFAISSGAYLVESNLGRKDMFPGDDPTLTGYRASAATAKYSRVLAAQMYGSHRPYGYAWGGSGGAFKTISMIENTKGVWDGAVPFISGSPKNLPSVMTVLAHAGRVLGDKIPQIVDSADPGGSGDIYRGLNEEEKAALREATRFGFPVRSWAFYSRFGMGPLAVLIDDLRTWDPTYFDDFWTKPGYLGSNPPASLTKARIVHATRIKRVITAEEGRKMGLAPSMTAFQGGNIPTAFELESTPDGRLIGAMIIAKSGAAAGKHVWIERPEKGVAVISFGAVTGNEGAALFKAGDEVMIDNSVYLAAQTYHRHYVQTPDYRAWDQFRGPDGKPIYPQRTAKLAFVEQGSGPTQRGYINAPVIVVNSAMDELALPWATEWYRLKVQAHVGADRLDAMYREYIIDHALHQPPVSAAEGTRIVDFNGAVQQALRDLSVWVEKGIAPPMSTNYTMDEAQIVLEPGEAARGGIQPLVDLTANGAARADVKVGTPVKFRGAITVPKGAGGVVDAEWDFDGTGRYPEKSGIVDTKAESVVVEMTHVFTRPGTYFPALRATSQRQGDAATPYARVQNLGRVRVVAT